MLNLDHITRDAQATIRVPILPALDFTPEDYAFTLRSLIDNRQVAMVFTPDLTLSANYVTFSVLYGDDAPDGEYAYTLTLYGPEGSPAVRVSEGLATVGDYIHPVTEHTETIQYKQYGN